MIKIMIRNVPQNKQIRTIIILGLMAKIYR